ncbi:Dps family protein [Sediminicoccus sp. BL-A-41-H5]|uniref:Dps family protein n=1 Tax=Sediminicoccus sp. BL-A-41-H5 TaxID=3421106 RepID=UPI003D66BC21
MDQLKPDRDMRGNGADGSALRAVLADTAVLLAKTQSCHWNAQGPAFYAIHELTEAQYQELFTALDVLGERLRAVGEAAPDGLGEMLEHASLAPGLGEAAIPAAVAALAADHARLAARAREGAEEMERAGDAGSHDVLIARVLAHEKAAWLLRSHLGPRMEAGG